jgi:adenosylmethionine-8-amino-7-oxononanoate aminotransferase
LATLAIFSEENIIEKNRLQAQKMAQALAPFQDHSDTQFFRQQGMILAVDAKLPEAAMSQFSRRFFTLAQQQELLLRPIGNTVYWMPPYILDDSEIAHMANTSLRVFEEVMSEIKSGKNT